MNALFPEDGSAVSFEAFMAYALHDETAGYYARRISTVGRGGDFTTTAEISPALAKAVAAWLVREMQSNGCRDVIELGPGSGALAAAVREALPWSWRWRTRWHLVETSATLRNIQAKRPALRRVRWHDSIGSALEACAGAACLYSNEFFDAFPVRLFQRANDGWKEVFVHRGGEGLREVLREVDALPESNVWQRSWPTGQRVEVHESVRQWLLAMAEHWRRGAMLTIDYGAAVDALYHRQPGGSLRAYLRQQRMTGAAIYQHIGRQDITADVNFSDLMAWTAGFVESAPLISQREFLMPHVDARCRGDVYAVEEAGAGDAFRVWQCSVGVSQKSC